jgi:hypothetical protein
MQEATFTIPAPPRQGRIEVRVIHRCELCGSEARVNLNGHHFCRDHFADGSAARFVWEAEGRA